MPDRRDNPTDFWKDLIQTELGGLRREAASSEPGLSRDLRSLKNLFLALRIERSLAPAPPYRRWPILIAFLGTFIIVSLAFFTHPRSTRIDLDASLSELSFQMARTAPFSFPALEGAASINGGSLLDVDDLTRVFHVTCLTPGVLSTPMSLQAVGAPGERNSISVNNVELPEGTAVTLVHTGKAWRYQVVLTPPQGQALPDITVSLEGRSRLTAGRCDGKYAGAVPTSLSIRPGSGETISITLNPLEESLSAPTNIPAKGLGFLKVEEGSDDAGDAVQPLSTVLSGSLYFDSISGKERKLRDGERLSLSGSQGAIHILSIEKDHLHLRFTGSVAGITSAESDSNTTLMPTWFDWLTSNHGLSSLWAAGLYCFGLVLALLRWWRP